MRALGRFSRKAAPPGSRRRRWLFLATLVVSVGALGAFLVSNALAVHDQAFQLDGDVSAATTTNVGGHPQPFDWDSFFNSSGNPIQASFPDPSVPGFTASGFDRDFVVNANGTYNTSDSTTYTQGSKDTLNISSNWVCTAANNVTNKGDIQNDYAVAYTNPTTHEQILYFALERNSNTGDANVAFWFLQDPTADCSTANGTTAWTGNHQDGDILIVSAFTGGGSVSTINAYRWNGGAGGSLGTTPVASGVDCRSASTPTGDNICATSNTATISTPWLTDNNGKTTGLDHSLLSGEFFEGGINLTNTGLAGKCFNTFVGDTRSSQSLTATLFDFARGTLGECHSTTVTAPTPAAGSSTEIPASASVTSSDSATITVDGVAKFSGTVKFSLCGPLALNSAANCQTGGVPIVTKTLTDATSPDTETSGNVTLTEVGKYCWRAEYSGDSARGVPPSTDPTNSTNQSECFFITPKTPTLTTCSGTYSSATPQVCTPDATVDFGAAVRDNANLTGTANEPGTGGLGDGSINPTGGNGPAQGTITFKLYGPDTAGSTTNCNTLAAGFPSAGLTASVNGDGVYGPVSFTPQAPGVYHWKASYGGDLPNTLSTDTNANCTDSNEDVTVRQIPTAITTTQKAFPEDSATITSTVAGNNLPAGGTVVFRLYGPTDGATPQTALQNCQAHGDTLNSGGLLYKETDTAGGNHSVTVDTNNTTVSVNTNDTFYWRVTYDPGDTAHTGRQSDCVENVSTAFTNEAGPGTLFP
jgi:hypothetical protein